MNQPSVQSQSKESLVKCEICGEGHQNEIATHLRKAHGMRVAEYMKKYPGAPVLHREVYDFLNHSTIFLDHDGSPWRLISTFAKLGFQAYGPVLPNPDAPAPDKYFEYNPIVTKMLYFAFETNRRVLLVGPPGTGKTELIRNMCAHLGWGFRRVNFNGQATPRTLFGSLRAGPGGETYFQYGALPISIMRQECILFDEVSFIDQDMCAGLHEVMEIGGSLTLLENGGQVIKPCGGSLFRIVGTDNVGMQGDSKGIYHGTKPWNAAFMDRWSVQVNVDYLSRDQETVVLTNKVPGLPKAVAEMMVDIAAESRSQAIKEDVLQPISLRQLLDWAALSVYYRNIKDGWTHAIVNKASIEDAVALKSLFGHKFPALE